MAFNDLFRISAHAVFTDADDKVLILKANYAEKRWGLPGGGLDLGEMVHQVLIRECKEELGVDVEILLLMN